MPNNYYIQHFGIKRRSGRYPWGSGNRPFQSTGGKGSSGESSGGKEGRKNGDPEHDKIYVNASRENWKAVLDAADLNKEIRLDLINYGPDTSDEAETAKNYGTTVTGMRNPSVIKDAYGWVEDEMKKTGKSFDKIVDENYRGFIDPEDVSDPKAETHEWFHKDMLERMGETAHAKYLVLADKAANSHNVDTRKVQLRFEDKQSKLFKLLDKLGYHIEEDEYYYVSASDLKKNIFNHKEILDEFAEKKGFSKDDNIAILDERVMELLVEDAARTEADPAYKKLFQHSDDENEDYIQHYGVKRRSGRYPYGSGEEPYQSTGGRPTGSTSSKSSDSSKTKASGGGGGGSVPSKKELTREGHADELTEISKEELSKLTRVEPKKKLTDEVDVSKAVKTKKISELTDDELRESIRTMKQRKALEDEFKMLKDDLSGKNKPRNESRTKKLVYDILEASGKNIGTQFVTFIMGSELNKALLEAMKKHYNDPSLTAIVNPKKGQFDKKK